MNAKKIFKLLAVVIPFYSVGAVKAEELLSPFFQPETAADIQSQLDNAIRELNNIDAINQQAETSFNAARANLSIHAAALRAKTSALLAHTAAQTKCPRVEQQCLFNPPNIYTQLYCEQARNCVKDRETFQNFEFETARLIADLAPHIAVMSGVLEDSEDLLSQNQSRREGFESLIESLESIRELATNIDNELFNNSLDRIVNPDNFRPLVIPSATK